MAQHNDFGKEGEILARSYLQSKGYVIREQNWRKGKLEVDLIAEKDNIIVIVEVKSRRRSDQEISEIVSEVKEKNLIDAADAYMSMLDEELECRIDLMIIHTKTGNPEVIHIENAISQT